jgi:hypothetical protein
MSEIYPDGVDDEQPQQQIRNETQLEPVSDQFKNLLTDCKRSIYTGIVFAHPEETKEAQDTTILNQYLRSLSALYGVMNSLPHFPIENIDWTKQPWSAIPEQAQNKTQAAVLWYNNFINHNKPIDRQQYTDYISSVLFRHPYSQVQNPEED